MSNLFSRRSLSEQFLLVSFPILLAGTLFIGWWIGRQVEESVVQRIGALTALYVDSFVGPHLQMLTPKGEIKAEDREMLASDLSDSQLGQKILALKIWRKDGFVLFSSDPKTDRQTFPVSEDLKMAFGGLISSEISERSAQEQAEHGQPLARVIETYTPIHADRNGGVIAVAEFYEKPDEVDKAVSVAQRQSWLTLSLTMLGMYLCLFLVVRRGSQTITEQRKSLRAKVSQLMLVNEKNIGLQERIISAAERSTSFNENFLQRLLQTIHDGPGQDLGFALMQIKNMTDSVTSSQPMSADELTSNLHQSRLAVQSALADLRAISADLELPDLNQLLPSMVVARVLRDFQGKTGVAVPFSNNAKDVDTSFRVKVALYRLLQESMANAFRHAQCKGSRVELTGDHKYLTLEISDSGPGFDPVRASQKGRLGLRGMRQRAEMLGGTFEVSSVVGAGTVTTVTLPLMAMDVDNE